MQVIETPSRQRSHQGGEGFGGNQVEVGVDVVNRQIHHLIQSDYFTTEVAKFGFSGFTSKVCVLGIITRSMSSIGMTPRRTSLPSTRAPAKPTRFLKCNSTGPT